MAQGTEMKALDNGNFVEWCCFGISDHSKRLVEPEVKKTYLLKKKWSVNEA